MRNRLIALRSELSKMGFEIESLLLKPLVKLSSVPGIDFPVDEIDVDDVEKAITYLQDNPGLTLHLDSPMGALKWTVDGSKLPMPFHYGEIIEVNNPSDDAGWDIVVAPEATGKSEKSGDISYIPSGHNLMPVGYVPINSDEQLWRYNTSTEDNPRGKPPPIGNDKIILAPNGSIKKSDMNKIEDFFGKIWNFNNIVWL